MDTRWAAASGLTVAVVVAIAGAWALRAPPDAPSARPVESADSSSRREGPVAVARSGPASMEPLVAPSAGAASAPPPPAGPIRQAPRFDVVRVEGDGAAVVAGRGEPGAAITLMVDGRSAGEAVADAAGQFVIVPTPLPPGERALSLASRARDGAATTSAQAVTILGAQEGRDRVVALAEPGAPTRILSDAAPKPADSVGIRTVEAEQGGAFYASGVAPAGANVRLYLNAGAVAEARASAQGAWSIRIEKGMKPGAYQVRADHLDAAGKVVSRAEVTFEYPAQTADVTPGALAPNVADQSAPRPAPSSAQATPSHTKPADTTVSQVRAQQVVRGDSLWRMSARLYGSGHRYTEIYAANARQIRNPDLIYPGQIFVAPDKP